jgi:hypothetical protein
MNEQLIDGEIFTFEDADGTEFEARKEYCNIQNVRTAIYRIYRNGIVIIRATDVRFVVATMTAIAAAAEWTSNDRSYSGIW